MDPKLSQAIREERLRQGLSKRQLANSVGVSPPLISWSETGNEPVSQNIIRRILHTLNINPEDFPELADTSTGAPEPSAPATPQNQTVDASPTTTQAARRRATRGQTPTQPKQSKQELDLAQQEEKEILIRELDRMLRIWSRMSDIVETEEGNWFIPPDTPHPEDICRENTRTGSCDQDSHQHGQYVFELKPGLVTIVAERPHPGRARLELHLQQPSSQPSDNPAWSFDGNQEREMTIQFIPVLDPDQRNPGEDRHFLTPGVYQLKADADTNWTFEWTQHTPGTGWLDLLEHKLTDPQQREWASPGLSWGGPTAPNWTQVEVGVRQETPGPMQVCAYPIDGSPAVDLLDQTVGPDPVTLSTNIDPEQEYIILIKAHSKWDIWFLPKEQQATVANETTSEPPSPAPGQGRLAHA